MKTLFKSRLSPAYLMCTVILLAVIQVGPWKPMPVAIGGIQQWLELYRELSNCSMLFGSMTRWVKNLTGAVIAEASRYIGLPLASLDVGFTMAGSMEAGVGIDKGANHGN